MPRSGFPAQIPLPRSTAIQTACQSRSLDSRCGRRATVHPEAHSSSACARCPCRPNPHRFSSGSLQAAEMSTRVPFGKGAFQCHSRFGRDSIRGKVRVGVRHTHCPTRQRACASPESCCRTGTRNCPKETTRFAARSMPRMGTAWRILGFGCTPRRTTLQWQSFGSASTAPSPLP